MSAITTFEHPSTKAKPLMVKNLSVGMTERGKIKIGTKGEKRLKNGRNGNKPDDYYQMPRKLDHFIVTGMERDNSGNFVPDMAMMNAIAQESAQDARRLTKLPVRLLFDEIALNFQSSYAAFKGRKLWCRGDGETAIRAGEQVPCTCPLLEPETAAKDRCKLNGRLQVMIDGASTVGGVWMFRTTSWNTVTGLYSSMAFIQSVTGGKLAGIPLFLTIGPKTVTTPDGSQMTAYIVGLEFAGTFEQLRDRSYKALLEESKHAARIEKIHEQATAMIAAPVISDDDEEDIRDEFYPGQNADADSAVAQTEPVEGPAKNSLRDRLIAQSKASEEPPPHVTDVPPDDGEAPSLPETVPYTASNGKTVPRPPDVALGMLEAAHSSESLSNEAFADLRDKNREWLAHFPGKLRHFEDIDAREAKQPA